jgi:catechol 2,3-dioxygenase-like lactoylglutathione lyase family enzyme
MTHPRCTRCGAPGMDIITSREPDMSNAEMLREPAVETLRGDTFDMKLEVIVIPVSDVDRAKRFYGDLGWRLDLDYTAGDDYRVIPFTPPGSGCSVIIGKNVTVAAPGSAQGLHLIVSDIDAARDALLRRGIKISEPFHDAGGVFHHANTKGIASGPNPRRKSYASYASFRDPDGNGVVFRVDLKDVATLPRNLALKLPNGGELTSK